MVPIHLAHRVSGTLHCSEGAAPNCDGMHGLGENLGAPIGPGSLRKPVGGAGGELRVQHDPHLMQLLRSLFFVITHQEILLRAFHIPGKLNTGADVISRDDLILFHFQVPSARPSPTPLPPALPDLLVHRARLDLTQLAPVVRGLFSAGLAESTRKTYKSGGAHYLRFCKQSALTPYPVSEDTLLLFIAHLHQARLAHGTVKSYLAAVPYEQIRRGLGDPAIHSMPQVEYVLKGVKKATPVSSRRRLPITPAILLALKRVWRE